MILMCDTIQSWVTYGWSDFSEISARRKRHFGYWRHRIGPLSAQQQAVHSSTPQVWHVCAMTRSHVCHDSFTCVPWLLHMCAMTPSHVWHDSFTCVTWLVHVCYMAHSRVCYDLITCVTCDMTHSHVWHGSFTCVTWLIHECVMT